jgi:hypothetical protein
MTVNAVNVKNRDAHMVDAPYNPRSAMFKQNGVVDVVSLQQPNPVIDGSYDTNYQVTVKHIPAGDQYEMYKCQRQSDGTDEPAR